jgi:hypothetical protein
MAGDTYIILGVCALVFGTLIFAAILFVLHRWKKKL